VKDNKARRDNLWFAAWSVLMATAILVGIIYFKVKSDISLAKIKLQEHQLQIELNSTQIPDIAKFVGLVEQLSEVSQGKLAPEEVVNVAEIIYKECAANKDIGLTPDIILGLIERESNFNPDAVSSAKAYGLMQIIEDTWLMHDMFDMWAFSPDVAVNPEINVRVGIAELVRLRRYWLREGQDNWMIPLTSYFWGVRNTWILLTSKTRDMLPSLEYGKGVLDLASEWRERGI
jgi:hypothetical protein